MSEFEDLLFLRCDNPDELSTKDREEYNRYWALRTVGERLREVQRLRIAKWGDAARGPMKRILKVINLDDHYHGKSHD